LAVEQGDGFSAKLLEQTNGSLEQGERGMNQIVQEMLDRGSTWTEMGRSAPFWFKAPAPGRGAVDDRSALMLPVKLRTALNGVWLVAVGGTRTRGADTARG
jgi:hypothetical protein